MVREQQVQIVAGAAAGLLVLVLVLVLFWTWRSRRQLVRRLASVTARLEQVHTADVVGKGRLESALASLERAAGIGVLRVSDAQDAVDRLSDTFRLVGHGIVVCDDDGEIVFRNDEADEAQADEVVTRMLAAALRGDGGSERVDVYGPPHRTLHVRAAGLVNASRRIGAAVVIEDVSERRRLEVVRRDFVANVGHELLAPIGALGALAETVAEEDDPAVVRRLAARLQREARRIGCMFDNLLALTATEAEESPRREPVPVHLILAEAAELSNESAVARGVRLELHEPPRRLTILGERRQLVSAVRALVDNAVASSEQDAEVVIDTRTNGAWVEVTVSDTGIGIAPGELDRIFERFYRVDRTRSRGAGLGLAIVRHVAAGHGGEVRVQSQEGRGSTFTLRLPAGPGPVAVSVPSAEAG